MKPNLHNVKELSLLLGILVAGIILVLFFISGGSTNSQVSGSHTLLQAPTAVKLFVEKATFLLSNIFTL